MLTHRVRERPPLQHHDNCPQCEQRDRKPVRIGHSAVPDKGWELTFLVRGRRWMIEVASLVAAMEESFLEVHAMQEVFVGANFTALGILTLRFNYWDLTERP